MIVSVIGCAAVVAGLGLFATASKHQKKIVEEYNEKMNDWKNNSYSYKPEKPEFFPVKAFLGISLIGAMLIGSQCIYAQDAGDVVVLRDFGGNIAGYTSETGFHVKAPWQDCIAYDVRNNVISFVSDGEEDYIGGSANGPKVTVNDSSGTKANIDLQVNYSLDPSKAVEIYRDYGTQENFVRSIAAVDARSVPREVSGQFDTITMLTNRGEFTDAIEAALKDKWEKYGLNIEQVSVQEIRYPDSITDSYAEAQKAEVDKQKALNDQETAKVKGDTKVIEAQKEAEANKTLTQSLTPEVLQQQYYDALKTAAENGGLIVVPDGSQPIVGANK